MLRIIIGFVSRRRLIATLEKFGFSDIDGYNNFRAFARYLDIENVENRLGGKVAFHIDLHNFGMVNHEIGRENGDKVLKNYYMMLQEAIGDKGFVARLGGDRFIGVFDRKVKRAVYDIFTGTPVSYGDESGNNDANSFNELVGFIIVKYDK